MVIRVLVKEKDRLVSLIRGRLDIGYEMMDEDREEMASFLLIKDLIALKPKVVQDELQRSMESIR